MERVRDRFARLDGLRIHFRDWLGPTPDAPLLVLLHGARGDAHVWDAFGPVLAARYRVIAVDARGHGESDWSPTHDYGVEDHVADVTQLIEALGYGTASLVGASMGGTTAYSVAALFPDVVERLVLVDISPGPSPGLQRL